MSAKVLALEEVSIILEAALERIHQNTGVILCGPAIVLVFRGILSLVAIADLETGFEGAEMAIHVIVPGIRVAAERLRLETNPWDVTSSFIAQLFAFSNGELA